MFVKRRTTQGWQRAQTRTHLDKGRPSTLHGRHQELVPPQCARALVITLLHAAPNPNGRHRQDDRHKDGNQVQEAQACCQRLEDIGVQAHVDLQPQAAQASHIVGHDHCQLLARRLEHALLRCLAIFRVIIFFGNPHKGSGTQRHARSKCACCYRSSGSSASVTTLLLLGAAAMAF